MIPTMIATWSRVSRMGWDEVRVRACQAVGKRVDWLKYQVGLPAVRKREMRRSPPAGQFFFSPEDLPGINRLLRENLSREVGELLREADETCDHRFRLLGYQDLDYGREIDWHLDAVHGARAPRRPWFKIPFLDFSVVGDHKVIWELNRHQHLVTLAQAWVLTGKEGYVAELLRQWYAWHHANPYPVGINWCSSLEVAVRSLSWLWVRALLAKCPAAPASFEDDLQIALALNARHIERYLSTYFSPNTHLLGEALALFFIGTLCQRNRDSERWRIRGWSILLKEAGRQVCQDGFYFEQSLYYHIYALDMFLHAYALARRNQVAIPRSFTTVVEKMLDALRILAQVGPPQAFGDDDGGRLFNPRRNRTEHLTDPLALGAVLLGRSDLRSFSSLTEEAIWLCPDHAADGLVAARSASEVGPTAFADTGLYLLASSAGQMVVDAGSFGTGTGGHGHADALSVTVSLDGRQWLIDPGTSSYMRRGVRRRFRSTRAHNTVLIDGLDQAVQDGPFAWRLQPTVRRDSWYTGKTFSFFAGSHTGYERLSDPVVHRRFVFHLHGGFWLVRDFLDGRQAHQVETNWHFAPDLSIRQGTNCSIAEPCESQVSPTTRLALVHPQGPTSRWEIGRGEYSDCYGQVSLAPALRMTAHLKLPAENVTLVRPMAAAEHDVGVLSTLQAGGTKREESAAGYCYAHSERRLYFFFAKAAGPWMQGEWASDAQFLYCEVRQGSLAHVVLCDGSFATHDGVPVMQSEKRTDFMETLGKVVSSPLAQATHATVHSRYNNFMARGSQIP